MDFPKDLKYSKDHEWARVQGDVAAVGITDYAQDSLGDIVYIELPSEGMEFEAQDSIGTIESVKAVAELYAPMSGTVLNVNASLAADPSQVSLDPYGVWLLEISGKPEGTLQAAEYIQFLADEWEKTSKLFKGQS